MTSMSPRSTRRWCRAPRPMSSSTGVPLGGWPGCGGLGPVTRGLDVLLLGAGLGVHCGCRSVECFKTQGKGFEFCRMSRLADRNSRGQFSPPARGDGSQNSGRSGEATKGFRRWGGSEHTPGQGVAGPPARQGAQAQLLLRLPCFSPAPPRPAAGRAARRRCGSGSRWCPWPPSARPAC